MFHVNMSLILLLFHCEGIRNYVSNVAEVFKISPELDFIIHKYKSQLSKFILMNNI